MITAPTQALQQRRYTQLHGSGDALALARLAAQAKPLIVLCASALDAQRLLEEIPYFAPGLAVNLLPDWETLPYDTFSPHHDLISERLATLYAITRGSCDVTLIPASTALYRLAPPSYLAAYTFFLKQEEKFSLPQLRAQLTLAGYSHVTQVVAPGEYCVRGGLIDLFPMGSALPYRIDLLDEEIETIRTFDVDTQRTIYKVKEVRLLPAREFPLDEAGRTRFRARFRETFEGDPSRSNIYKDVSNGIAPGGIEYLSAAVLRAHRHHVRLPAAAGHAVPAPRRRGDHRRVLEGHAVALQLLRGDRAQPLLSPVDMFLPAEEFFIAAKNFARIDISAPQEGEPTANGGMVAAALPPLAVERRAADPLTRLKAFLAGTPARVLLLAESPGRRETMSQYLAEYGLAPAPCANFAEFLASSAACMLGTAPLFNGFALADENLCIVTEAELYAGTVRAGKRAEARPTSVEGMVRDLSELRVGDPVVHAQHGIGRYLGLANLDLGEGETEFLHLEYAGRRQALRAGGAAAPDQPLQRRRAGAGAAAQARQRRLGQAPRRRRRSRSATPPPSCSTSTPSAPRARGMQFENQAARSGSVRRGLRLRGNHRPGGRDPRRGRRHALGQADGPADLRRRRLRQDRGRAARRLRRGAAAASRSPCSCRPRCSPSSTSRLSPTASQMREWPIKIARAVALPHGEGTDAER